jgi:hypothetical protein
MIVLAFLKTYDILLYLIRADTHSQIEEQDFDNVEGD